MDVTGYFIEIRFINLILIDLRSYTFTDDDEYGIILNPEDFMDKKVNGADELYPVIKLPLCLAKYEEGSREYIIS